MTNNFKKVIATALTAVTLSACVVVPTAANINFGGTSIVSSIEASAVQAESYCFYKATANVNVRTTPSTNGKKVGLVKKGERVTVFQIKNGWGRITPAGAKQAHWVCMTYFTRVTVPGVVNPRNGVNVRATPSINGRIVGGLGQGTKVTIYKIQVTSDGRVWASINSAGTRWVCAVDKNGVEYVSCAG